MCVELFSGQPMAQQVTATSPLLVIPVGADLLVEVANSVSFVHVQSQCTLYCLFSCSGSMGGDGWEGAFSVAQWGAMVGRGCFQWLNGGRWLGGGVFSGSVGGDGWEGAFSVAQWGAMVGRGRFQWLSGGRWLGGGVFSGSMGGDGWEGAFSVAQWGAMVGRGRFQWLNGGRWLGGGVF